VDGEIVDAAGNTFTGRRHAWVYEDRVYPNFALNAVIDRDPSEFGLEPFRFEDIMPGCYDPAARLKDMDAAGVHAQLCFPTFPRLAGVVFLEGDDKPLALACVQAYNDFIIDEWCAAAPDRYIPMAILPLWDVQACVTEILRTAGKGIRAVTFPESPARLGLPSFSADAPQTVWITTMGTNSMVATADLLFSPVFHEFPRLRVALSEGGIGWIPYLLERADFVWERHRFWTGVNAHADSNWPNSRKLLEEALSDVPDDDALRIAETNARELLGFGSRSTPG
jgi:predicted TIM-barrel fold metal-dependent hydrolase